MNWKRVEGGWVDAQRMSNKGRTALHVGVGSGAGGGGERGWCLECLVLRHHFCHCSFVLFHIYPIL